MECTLRRWRPEDRDQLAVLINNPNILKNLRDGIPYPYTPADADVFIARTLAADPDQVFAFAVTDGETLIGSVKIVRQENVHRRTAELGYYIGQDWWGKGYGTSAVRQACQLVFSQSDILRIYADPYAWNTASCRVLEKAGFQLEGILRKNAIKDGQVTDMKMYALLRD